MPQLISIVRFSYQHCLCSTLLQRRLRLDFDFSTLTPSCTDCTAKWYVLENAMEVLLPKIAEVQKMLSLWRKYRSFCRYISRCHAILKWFCASACIEPLRHFCVSVILNAKAPPNFALSNLWTSFSLPWKSQHREKSQLFFASWEGWMIHRAKDVLWGEALENKHYI